MINCSSLYGPWLANVTAEKNSKNMFMYQWKTSMRNCARYTRAGPSTASGAVADNVSGMKNDDRADCE